MDSVTSVEQNDCTEKTLVRETHKSISTEAMAVEFLDSIGEMVSHENLNDQIELFDNDGH